MPKKKSPTLQCLEYVTSKMYDEWFLREPVLHAVLCSHELRENEDISIPVRAGKGIIEYNPNIIKFLLPREAEQLFKLEAIRILLKHPYSRQPQCPLHTRAMASDMTFYGQYEFEPITYAYMQTAELTNPADYGLGEGEHFEWYANQLRRIEENNRDNDDASCINDIIPADLSSIKTQQAFLWEEDEVWSHTVDEIIKTTKQWGTISGNLKTKIESGTKARIDYRKVLSGFRASMLSSRRSLTRMRPNRRTEFENMGSLYRLRSRLLVAVDTSGSVSKESLADFYGIINKFFRYGVEEIDTVQFDCELKDVVPLKKAKYEVEITGRGGTNFQQIFDFVGNADRYDGIIVMTDGYADVPTVKKTYRTPKCVWVITDKESYEYAKERLSAIGRVCYIEELDNRRKKL